MTQFGSCMRDKLGGGKMKGKSKAARKAMFKKAVRACRK